MKPIWTTVCVRRGAKLQGNLGANPQPNFRRFSMLSQAKNYPKAPSPLSSSDFQPKVHQQKGTHHISYYIKERAAANKYPKCLRQNFHCFMSKTAKVNELRSLLVTKPRFWNTTAVFNFGQLPTENIMWLMSQKIIALVSLIYTASSYVPGLERLLY